jgi:hypothetical protein
MKGLSTVLKIAGVVIVLIGIFLFRGPALTGPEFGFSLLVIAAGSAIGLLGLKISPRVSPSNDAKQTKAP